MLNVSRFKFNLALRGLFKTELPKPNPLWLLHHVLAQTLCSTSANRAHDHSCAKGRPMLRSPIKKQHRHLLLGLLELPNPP